MKLTDTQLVLLSQASQRPDRCAQLPPTLKGSPAQKLVVKLLGAGLVEEVRAEAEMPVWRKGDDGAFALRVTEQGLAATSVDAEETATPSPGACAVHEKARASPETSSGAAEGLAAFLAAAECANETEGLIQAGCHP